MRIWIINHYAVPPSSSGGTRHFSLARHLIAKGHEVVIIAANYNHFTHTWMVPADKTRQLDIRDGVPFYWLPVPPYRGNTLGRFWNMLVFAWQISRLKALSPPKPDIIIGSSPHLFAALGAERLARRLKIPFVLEIRDIWPDTLVDLGKFTHRHPLIRVMKQIEKYLYRHASSVITLLPCADQYLLRYGVEKSRQLWLPNSVDTCWIQPKHKVASDCLTFMYAGAHGLANDLDTVIDAATLLQERGLTKQMRICLIGEGPEKARLREMAQRRNLTIIEFLDPVPKSEVYTVLETADVFLMLLKKSPVFRWGISPNKLFDYFAMERPVIFGVETPMNQVAVAQAGISIPSSDPEALAAAMIEMCQLSQEERDAMGRRGKEYVAEYHDIARLANKLDTKLEECVGVRII